MLKGWNEMQLPTGKPTFYFWMIICGIVLILAIIMSGCTSATEEVGLSKNPSMPILPTENTPATVPIQATNVPPAPLMLNTPENTPEVGTLVPTLSPTISVTEPATERIIFATIPITEATFFPTEIPAVSENNVETTRPVSTPIAITVAVPTISPSPTATVIPIVILEPVVMPTVVPTSTPVLVVLPTATSKPVPTPTVMVEPTATFVPTSTAIPVPTVVPTPMYYKGTDDYGDSYYYPWEKVRNAFQVELHKAMDALPVNEYPPVYDPSMNEKAQEYADAKALYRNWPDLTNWNDPVYHKICNVEYVRLDYGFAPRDWTPEIDDVAIAIEDLSSLGGQSGFTLQAIMEPPGRRRYGVGVAGGSDTLYQGDVARPVFVIYYCFPKFSNEQLQDAIEDVLAIERAEYRLPDRITLFHGTDCITNILSKTNSADPGVNDIRDSDGRTQLLYFAAQVDGGGIQNCTGKVSLLLKAYGVQGHELSDYLGSPLRWRDVQVEDYLTRLDDDMFAGVKREGLIDLAYTDDSGKTACDYVLEGIAAEIAYKMELEIADGEEPDPYWYDGLQVSAIPWICDAIGQDAVIVDEDGNELGTVEYDADHFLYGVLNLH